jgi:hypothetical protein
MFYMRTLQIIINNFFFDRVRLGAIRAGPSRAELGKVRVRLINLMSRADSLTTSELKF